MRKRVFWWRQIYATHSPSNSDANMSTKRRSGDTRKGKSVKKSKDGEVADLSSDLEDEVIRNGMKESWRKKTSFSHGSCVPVKRTCSSLTITDSLKCVCLDQYLINLTWSGRSSRNFNWDRWPVVTTWLRFYLFKIKWKNKWDEWPVVSDAVMVLEARTHTGTMCSVSLMYIFKYYKYKTLWL